MSRRANTSLRVRELAPTLAARAAVEFDEAAFLDDPALGVFFRPPIADEFGAERVELVMVAAVPSPRGLVLARVGFDRVPTTDEALAAWRELRDRELARSAEVES